MSYYTLEPACNTPETGPVFPQIQKLKPGYDDKKSDSIYSYLKKSISDFPDEAPDLDSFIMHGYAKPTDMVSNAITKPGFFIDKKVKSIFEKYNLIPHRFYPAKVIHKKKLLDNYFWVHMMADFTDCIDYPNSSFFIRRKFFTDTGDEIKIESLEDYFEKRKQLKLDNPETYVTINAKRICWYPAFFNKKLDFFEIGPFDANFYISQRLRDALVENKITGCNIQPTDRIIT
jgi:hypothetical protein